jgi:hypothetical protein
MRRSWDGLVLLFAVAFTLAGCATEDHLKPPKPPECYDLPPQTTRFCQPTEIPRKFLMEDLPRKDFDPSAPASPLRNAGAGAGGTRGF